jgi:hypothetical protein
VSPRLRRGLDKGLAGNVRRSLEALKGLTAHLLGQKFRITTSRLDLAARHRAVTAGTPFGADQGPGQDTGAAAPIPRADRQDESALILAGTKDPLRSFEAEEKIGHLGRKIGPVHEANIAEDDILIDAGGLERGGKLPKVVRWDLGTMVEIAPISGRTSA